MEGYEFAADPLWWRPFGGIDSDLRIDPLMSVTGRGTGTEPRVVLHYASGASVAAVIRCPLPGVVRLTIGDADLVLHSEDHEVAVEQAGPDSVRIAGPGVIAALGPGGLVTDTLPRPGGSLFAVADPDALPIVDMAAGTGRLLHRDRPVGWAESIALATGSAVFGGGENFQSLDLRGRRRTLLNRETHTATGRDLAYLNVPLLWSTSGWAVLVNTGGMVGVDAGASQQELLSIGVAGASLDLLAFAGPPSRVLATYWELTGAPGPLPDWSFGVWLSRATFISESEIGAVLDDLEAADALPDVVHVDGWLAGNVFRTFTCEWQADRQRFPDGWTERLRRRGVRSSVWLNPFVLADSDVGEALREQGLLLRRPDGEPACTADRGNRWIVDFTNPAARTWWRNALASLLTEVAPDALKLDFAEEMPLDAVCQRRSARHGHPQRLCAHVPAGHGRGAAGPAARRAGAAVLPLRHSRRTAQPRALGGRQPCHMGRLGGGAL